MSGSNGFSHLDPKRKARMVDVGAKAATHRVARAEAIVHLPRAIAARLAKSGSVDKGNVIETARVAGILAAKRTADIIPMCHPLPIDSVEIEARLDECTLRFTASVRAHARTGVEMESLLAASVAALTAYDMCKSAGKGIEIGPVRLLEKRGGRSGPWRRTGDGAHAG